MYTNEALYASLAFNGLTTIIIIILCWRCFRRRHCCSRSESRQFSKLEETLSDERRRTNGEHMNDYASVKHATTRKDPVEQTRSEDDVIIDSQKSHDLITTVTKVDTSVVEEDATVSKEASVDWNGTKSATIIDIDETSNDVIEQSGAILDEKQDSCSIGKTDDVDLIIGNLSNIVQGQPSIVPDQRDIVLGQPSIVPDQRDIVLDQQTEESLEEDFEETFDKRHSSNDDEEAIVKPSMTVQVFSKADIPIIRNAAEELMSSLEVPELLITHEHLQNMASVNPELPLLIICVHTSRLGTDATNAVKGLLHPKSTVLLILHHQEKHALPVNRSDRILVDPQFDNIGGIFDFAYRADSGMYSCDMNTMCVEELEKFIRTCHNSTD